MTFKIRIPCCVTVGTGIYEKEVLLDPEDAELLVEFFEELSPKGEQPIENGAVTVAPAKVRYVQASPKSEPMTPAKKKAELSLLRRAQLDETQRLELEAEREGKSPISYMSEIEATPVIQWIVDHPGERDAVIAERFGLTEGCVGAIRIGNSWLWLSGFTPRGWRSGDRQKRGVGFRDPSHYNRTPEGRLNVRAKRIIALARNAKAHKAMKQFVDSPEPAREAK